MAANSQKRSFANTAADGRFEPNLCLSQPAANDGSSISVLKKAQKYSGLHMSS